MLSPEQIVMRDACFNSVLRVIKNYTNDVEDQTSLTVRQALAILHDSIEQQGPQGLGLEGDEPLDIKGLIKELGVLRSELERLKQERDAALAKCAEMVATWEEFSKHLPIGEYRGLGMCRAAHRGNPGQPLLDRLALAEKVVKAAEACIDVEAGSIELKGLKGICQALAAYREAAGKENAK